jgi:hypothetical protein
MRLKILKGFDLSIRGDTAAEGGAGRGGSSHRHFGPAQRDKGGKDDHRGYHPDG